MALISTNIPNLVGGVTQQSDALRYENQCTDQVNASPSVTNGLEKRHPTEHLAVLKDVDDDEIVPSPASYKVHTHTINRDTDERYVVTVVQEVNNHGYSDGKPRANIYIHDIAGAAQIVYFDPDLLAGGEWGSQWVTDSFLGYLSPLEFDTAAGEWLYFGNAPSVTVSPGENEPDLKFATVGDVTLVLNTKVAPQGNILEWYQGPNGGSYGKVGTIQVRKATYDAEYGVTFNSRAKNETTGNPIWTTGEVVYTTPTNQVTKTTTVVLETIHIASHEFGPGVTDGPEEISNSTIATAWATQINTALAAAAGSPGTAGNLYALASADTIQIFTTSDSQGNHGTGYNPGFDMEVSGPAKDSVSGYTFNVSNFTELADIAGADTETNPGFITSGNYDDAGYLGGHKIEVTHSPESDDDDYWVEFIPKGEVNRTSTGAPLNKFVSWRGRWKEAAAPRSKRGIHLEYGMPLLIIRQADGTFMVTTANGVTPSTNIPEGAHSAYDKYRWRDRRCGDSDTNKDPTFANKLTAGVDALANKINGMVFYNNRLVFVTDENVCMSEAGDIWNFYRTTVTSILDSDPIDVATTNAKVSILRHAIGFEDRLLLMSDQTQFLCWGEPVLAPDLINIAPVTTHESLKGCAPITQGKSAFFAFKRGEYSGVREWFSSDISNMSYGSSDITAHIPAYIAGNITSLTASSHANIIIATSDSQRDTLYVFNFYGEGANREQAAWGTYTFGGGAVIHEVSFIDETAYVVIERPSVGDPATGVTLCLEKIDFQANKIDAGSDYLTCIDRKIDQESCGEAYDAPTNITTITIPYHIQSGVTMQVVSKSGELADVTEATVGGKTIKVKGDWRATATDTSRRTFWVGEQYEMSYRFSKPLFKPTTSSGGKSLVAQGRHQLRYGNLIFANSGAFDVKITQADGTEFIYPYTGKTLGSSSSTLGTLELTTGEFRFPIFSESNSITIDVTNDYPIPSHLESAEFEANYTTRSKRIN